MAIFDRMAEATELLEAIEWFFIVAGVRMCPRCVRTQSEGHTPTCRIGRFLGRETRPDGAAPAAE